MKKVRLNKNEREILDAIENGKWELVKLKKPELERFVRIARNTLKKNQQMPKHAQTH